MHTSQGVASRERKNYQVRNPSTAKNKEFLRKQLRKIHIAHPAEASRRIVDSLASKLQTHPEWQCIALYSALPGEPDLSGLTAKFPNHSFVYPRVQGDFMTFHLVCDPEKDWVVGPWGLREPKESTLQVSAKDFDVMLCPGMAFTREGKRLGKGRGYYDRYLEPYLATRPYCIGVCFAEFLLDDLPSDPHDIPMDEVISG